MTPAKQKNNVPLILGVFAGLLVGYWLLNTFLLSPMAQLRDKDLPTLKKDIAEQQRLAKQAEGVRKRWKLLAGHTLARATSINEMHDLLNRLIDKHELENRTIRPSVGNTLVREKKKDIVQVLTCNVHVTGSLPRVTAFLRDVYEQPILKKVAKLTLRPTEQVGGGEDMSLDMQIDTLTFVDTPRAPGLAPMPPEKVDALGPLHIMQFMPVDYMDIARSNLFAAFEAPPRGKVIVKNNDRKPIQVKIETTWEDQPRDSRTFEVGEKASAESPMVEGDVVRVTATHEDGSVYSDKGEFHNKRRFDPQIQSFNWTVPLYTPEAVIPPDTVEVTIENKDTSDIVVAVQIQQDGDMMELAPVTVKSLKTHKLKKTKTPRMILTAKYEGDVLHAPQTFSPSKSVQTCIVPPKPEKPVVTQTPEVVVESLPPPDPNKRVSGVYILSDGMELFVWDDATSERSAIAVASKIDSGELIYVHETGGIVKMPNGEYYLYPMGFKFADRICLEGVKHESQLPAAIDKLVREDKLVPQVAAAPGGAEGGAPRPGGASMAPKPGARSSGVRPEFRPEPRPGKAGSGIK